MLTLLSRYDFEYEDDDDEESGDVDIENKYYNAKQMKADNPEEAIDEFLGLPALEPEKGDWSVVYCSLLLWYSSAESCSSKGVQRNKAGREA